MTIPLERTQAVLGARQLLTELAGAPDDAELDKFRLRSRKLLRHYPEPVHIRLSAGFAPGIWAEPDEK
jgi:hypothetical protein